MLVSLEEAAELFGVTERAIYEKRSHPVHKQCLVQRGKGRGNLVLVDIEYIARWNQGIQSKYNAGIEKYNKLMLEYKSNTPVSRYMVQKNGGTVNSWNHFFNTTLFRTKNTGKRVLYEESAMLDKFLKTEF